MGYVGGGGRSRYTCSVSGSCGWSYRGVDHGITCSVSGLCGGVSHGIHVH